jgi:hypothetical protein
MHGLTCASMRLDLGVGTKLFDDCLVMFTMS